MITLQTKKITSKNFTAFGQLVSIPLKKPTAQGKTYRFWSDIARYTIDGETEIGLCTVYKNEKNLITGLERHLYTPEILIPVDDAFVLPVLKEGEPLAAAASFRIEIGQAVVINQAVWHGACIPASLLESSYFVIFKRKTPDKDVELKDIESLQIRF